MTATLYNKYITKISNPPFPPCGSDIAYDTNFINISIESVDLTTGAYNIKISKKQNEKYIDPADYAKLDIEDIQGFWTLNQWDIMVLSKAIECNGIYDMDYIQKNEKTISLLHITEYEDHFIVEAK